MPEDSKSPEHGYWARLGDNIKGDLIAGLVVVIPLATTLWLSTIVARWVVAFLTSVPKQFNPFQNLNPLLLGVINLLVGVLVPLLGIFLIGLIARSVFTRSVFELGEGVLAKIPFAGAVYKTLKQILGTLLQDNPRRFRRVVLVEYPREGIWGLGFVTNDKVGQALREKFPGKEMVSVFIPTSPNPTTGWYALVPAVSVKVVNISVDVAFRTIVSAGIVNPDEQLVVSTNPGVPQASRQPSGTISPSPQPEG